ncbi:MAG: zinc-dependent dehydrogenase [Bryobacteraceae bacterium]|nr:zinc-dependent dehydrogenase [Bryobacteraceae bacterium]
MKAAVYRGRGEVSVEPVPVPSIGRGELLVRVECCGICNTDLKKIQYNLLPPPRIYGHETAGVVVQAGEGVRAFGPGDRVVVFHHIPCMACFYCNRKLYAQCETYKRVGVTAGWEPAGGGFAQYVRVMDWIVERGVEEIPEGVSFERASWVEPVNTCLKAVEEAAPKQGELVAILGQGPIGLLFTMLVRLRNAAIAATDAIPRRRELALRFGADHAWDPLRDDVVGEIRKLSGGRGADLVIVAASAPGIVEQAVSCSRPGSRILLFAQTSDQERIEVSGAAICKEERTLFGCYSASVDLQKESARLVFDGIIAVEDLISHRLPLDAIGRGIALALHPDGESLKIVVLPQRMS